MKAKSLAACFAIAAAIPLTANAEHAFTIRVTEVFAGPSSEYPPIAQLPPSTAVNVAGCLSDWSWCDVIFARERGWVYAADLAVPFQGARVTIIEYGPRIHLPVVTFSLVTYWDRYYRSRPFYRERQQWVSRVHIEASHGGRAPTGHEATAQTAPSAQPQQAQPRRAPAPRTAASEQAPAKTERAQTHTARPAEPSTRSAEAEKARHAETARAPKEAPQPKDAQRPQVAQSPQFQQPVSRPPRKAQDAQQPQAAPSQQREHQPQQTQSPKTEPGPPADRAQEADRREAGKAQHEEKASGQQ